MLSATVCSLALRKHLRALLSNDPLLSDSKFCQQSISYHEYKQDDLTAQESGMTQAARTSSCGRALATARVAKEKRDKTEI